MPTREVSYCEILARMTAGLMAVYGLLLAGCAAPAQPSGPSSQRMIIPDREKFIDAALTILREHDLQPDRVDWSSGEIVTQPTTSGQWLEFWRVDSQGAYQQLESSLHTVQRVVTVRLEPPESPSAEPAPATQPDAIELGVDGEEVRVVVEVKKLRYSAPERQVTTASGALAIYSERLPTTEGLFAAGRGDDSWTPLGRDPLLERYLLDRLSGALPTVTPLGPPTE